MTQQSDFADPILSYAIASFGMFRQRAHARSIEHFVKIVAVLTVLIVGPSTSALAINVGSAGIGGTGCAVTNTVTTLFDGVEWITVLIDSPAPETEPYSAGSFRRTVCNLAVPLDVEPGKSVRIIAAEHRGYLNIPGGVTSTFGSEYFFAGTRGPVTTHAITGPFVDDYTINVDLAGNALWTACGADTILRANPSIRTTTPSGQAADAGDQNVSIRLRIQVRNC